MLTSDSTLIEACKEILDSIETQKSFETWLPELTLHLEKIDLVDEKEFRTREFQDILWNSRAISDTGQGNIDVSDVLENNAVVGKLWHLKTNPLPSNNDERLTYLAKAYDDCMLLVRPLVNKAPRLKLYRVFAAIFPTEFTTIAHAEKIYKLAIAMGLKNGYRHVVDLHQRILARLGDVLGLVPQPPEHTGVVRMMLPWLLYSYVTKRDSTEPTIEAAPRAGVERLIPLPAARRRKGMMAIGGSVETLASMLEFAKDGCLREDFKDHIRSINPRLTDASVGTTINALIGDWGALRASGSELYLTDRADTFLHTGRKEVFADWLLTRVLGVDNLLHRLNNTAISNQDLIDFLKTVNPGWTSNYTPSALIGWVKSLDLIRPDAQKLFSLTAEGEEWLALIHWTPGILKTSTATLSNEQDSPVEQVPQQGIIRRPVTDIIAAISAEISFPPELIARLDASLWQHPKRHFAVLTGLSGAGKTLLARAYAKGIRHISTDPEQGLYTLPVQPGWHDPSSLLGYVNPLNGTSYVSTAFLQFLLRASGDPSTPYTVVLDEMNLSHPEQYLAPLLSAMETGEHIELHAYDEEINGVPPSIPYPDNLVIIGTINMDETTHGLSDKILDRASVIEFWKVDVGLYPGWKNSELPHHELLAVKSILTNLSEALQPVRLHFGWRVIGDILGYLDTARTGGVLEFPVAMDHAIYSKILPKLRGEDTPRLREALAKVYVLLRDSELQLPESLAKSKELAEDLRHTGTARFWR